jgi:hypothetical protein
MCFGKCHESSEVTTNRMVLCSQRLDDVFSLQSSTGEAEGDKGFSSILYLIDQRPQELDLELEGLSHGAGVDHGRSLLMDEYIIGLEEQGSVRISPTDVSQFIRLDQCER